RMVCFDISNFGPDQAVAAVVASEDGRPRKALYRRMRIRRPGPDDFAMIGEAVERYWTRVESGELPRPDLVVIDGGAGQLAAARGPAQGVRLGGGAARGGPRGDRREGAGAAGARAPRRRAPGRARGGRVSPATAARPTAVSPLQPAIESWLDELRKGRRLGER